jgi:hypothetical protein
MAASADSSQRSERTGRPDSAWKVSGVTNCRAPGHDDLHLDAALAQAPHQFGALVRGDAAGDAEQDAGRRNRVHGAIMGRRDCGPQRGTPQSGVPV